MSHDDHDGDRPEGPGGALLYDRVAAHLASLIINGSLRPGDRLPSVRSYSRDRRVSVATVLKAYLKLENDGLIEVRPKSGHFVKRIAKQRKNSSETSRSAPARRSAFDTLIESMSNPNVVPLGSALVAPQLLPVSALNRRLSSLARESQSAGAGYDSPPGLATLRRQLARRSAVSGLSLVDDDFLTTVGAMEAISLALRALTKPGDIIVTPSPMYFGVLRILVEELMLRVLEIPADPREGMDLGLLEQALSRGGVRAAVCVPNFDNPLGSLMSDEGKEKMVAMLARHDVPLIEDDVYGDLSFDGGRPRPAKAFDRKGLVILCGSISKTLAPGYRVGWMTPGRYANAIRRLKLAQTIATPTLTQMAVAEYLASGGYDRHLRRLRARLEEQVLTYRDLLLRSFPSGTVVSEPRGGFVLWVTMPRGCDSIALQEAALARDVSIAPGPLFGIMRRYASCFRVSCGHPVSPRVVAAIRALGELCAAQLKRGESRARPA